MRRDLFFVVFDYLPTKRLQIAAAMPFSTMDPGRTLIAELNTTLNTYAHVQEVTGRSKGPPRRVVKINEEDVFFYSWNSEPLSASLPAVSVPRPGVVIALKKSDSEGTGWPPNEMERLASVETNRMVFNMLPEEGKALREFLQGHASYVDPIKTHRTDVFLSYAYPDTAYADELKKKIEDRGLRVFMAGTDLTPGSEWSDDIRDRLRDSKSAVILLTHDSKDRQWVMAEAGALWALGVPFVPATISIRAGDGVPEFISRRQAIDVGTVLGKEKCAQALYDIVHKKA